ncbi:MAG: Hsp20/alpha crystallin family protein [Candidatus Eremiobacteraeota bacterium]|nr:Hsp20/alpha crystallin family protein [Candidatus Eremiobacteraeota bacterium]
MAANRPTDIFGFDPFRNFFSNLSQFHGLEISRTDQGYEVEIPVPGYKPDQIEVTLDNGVLQVAGKNDRRTFTRSLALPEEIDSENIEANVEHGLLTIRMNLSPKAQPKKIAVGSQESGETMKQAVSSGNSQN